MPRILAVITARGGSKSIPGKNIHMLGGKPLIAYTIEAALASTTLTRTILSTDSEEIAAIARSYGCEVPFMRPAHLSQDTSTSLEAVQHALQTLRLAGDSEYDYLMILQPTSPFRTAEDIDAASRLAKKTDADSVMSMVELVDFSIKKLKHILPDGMIVPFHEPEGPAPSQRQAMEPVYKRNAAIYLTKTSIIEQGSLFGERSYAYVMPQERSLDINQPIDIEIAECLLQRGA